MEFSWKHRAFGTCSVALRCPYNHHQVAYQYGAGTRREKARAVVIGRWNELMAKETKNG
jgi:hypothetical protein